MPSGRTEILSRAVLIGTIALLVQLIPPFGDISSLSQPRPEDPKIVRFGVYQNRPKVFMNDQGIGTGFFAEMIGKIGAEENWNIQEVPCEWSECLKDLEAGRIDLMPDVAWSAERAARFDFHSTPVLESWSQIYCRNGSYPQTLEDLSGMRVAVLRDSIQHDSFQELSRGFGIDVEIIPTDTLDQAFLAVREGQADAAIANRFFGDYFFSSYGLSKTPVVFQPVNLYFATGKGRNADILRAIDKTIIKQRRTPNSPYYKTLARWMTGPSIPRIPTVLLWILGGIIFLLLVFMIASAILRHQVLAKTAYLANANAELKNLSQALIKKEALLALTQEIALVGGWEWEVAAKKMTWTDETYKMHGFERSMFAEGSDEHIRQSLELYDPEDRERVAAAFRLCVRDGTPYDMEARFIPKNRPPMIVRTTARAMRDDSGAIVRVVGIFMDITRLKDEEAARATAEEKLRIGRRMETIGHLTGGIAHDFNNLLSAIIGYSGLILRRDDTDEAVKTDLGQIHLAGEKAANLSHQLLAFGSRKISQPRPISLNSVVSGLEKMLQRLLGENITVKVELSSETGTIMADQGQMEQVIINLAVNSRDAMPDGGVLRISTTSMTLSQPVAIDRFELPEGRWVILSVKDSGIGMDEDTRNRIFEPFFTTKQIGRGSGLGLATVCDIVKQSGGFIQVESEPGQGAAFSIYLPGLDIPAAAMTVDDGSSIVKGSGTILLVEDDRSVRFVSERILLEAGYRVLTAADGTEALGACQLHSGDIDLVLTDIIMPAMAGDEFAEKLKTRYPKIPVLFMSGYADDRIADNPAFDPEVNFISKPFKASELTRRIASLLKKSAAPEND